MNEPGTGTATSVPLISSCQINCISPSSKGLASSYSIVPGSHQYNFLLLKKQPAFGPCSYWGFFWSPLLISLEKQSVVPIPYTCVTNMFHSLPVSSLLPSLKPFAKFGEKRVARRLSVWGRLRFLNRCIKTKAPFFKFWYLSANQFSCLPKIHASITKRQLNEFTKIFYLWNWETWIKT